MDGTDSIYKRRFDEISRRWAYDPTVVDIEKRRIISDYLIMSDQASVCALIGALLEDMRKLEIEVENRKSVVIDSDRRY